MNNDQAEKLSKKWSINIFTLDFSKNSLEESVSDIFNFYKEINPIGFIGISSGAFLVLEVVHLIDNIPLFIYLLGPVLSPKGREPYVSKTIIEKQQRYFNSKVPEMSKLVRTNIHILLSDTDENIPFEPTLDCIKRYPRTIIKILHGCSHKEICMNIEDV